MNVRLGADLLQTSLSEEGVLELNEHLGSLEDSLLLAGSRPSCLEDLLSAQGNHGIQEEERVHALPLTSKALVKLTLDELAELQPERSIPIADAAAQPVRPTR